MINVNLPDGSVAQFPDGTTPDVMKAAIQKKFPPDNPPAGATPGDLAYKNWAIARAKAGKSLPQVSPTPPSAGTPPQVTANQSPNLLNSTLATVNGMTGAIPGLQQASDGLLAMGQTVGDIFANRPGTVEQHYADIQRQRQQVAANAPVANVLGSLAPGLATAGLATAVPAVGEAMGITGSFGKQLLNSTLFGAGLGGTQGLVNGQTGGQLLADEGLGAAGGALGSVLGQGIGQLGQTAADAMTQSAQNKLINAAVQGSNLSAADIKSGASGLFKSSVDDNPIQLTSDAYNNLLGNISNSLQNMRPNELNNGPVVGVLQKMWGLGRDAADPMNNAVIDLKDLHILRQAANEVAGMSGQNGMMGHTIVSNIDSFINGLKPQDIAGGADPSQAGADLLQGISDWARAKKVDILENAVQTADGLKSSPADNLKTTFSRIMRSKDDFAKFSPAEQNAIRQVAKGTPGQNLASLIGKLGVSIGDGPHNIVGAGVGTTGLTAALAPFLGPAAFPAAATATTGAGYVGRRLAEDMANAGANRAIQAVAVGSIPAAAQVSNMFEGPAVAANLLTRSIVPILPQMAKPMLSGSVPTN